MKSRPTLAPTNTPALGRAQHALLAWGLPGGPSRIELDGADDAAHLVRWAIGERLTGILAAAIEHDAIEPDAIEHDAIEHDAIEPDAIEHDAIDLPPDAARDAADAHLTHLGLSLTAEVAAAGAVRDLAAVGIDTRVLKGLATSHLDHPEPARRHTADADLLVARPAFLDAISALQRTGHIRLDPTLGPRWEARFGRAVTLRSPVGAEIDLHAALAPGWFGERLRTDDLFAAPPAGQPDPDRFVLAGITCRALPRPARLMHTALVEVLGRRAGARTTRDLLEMLAHGTSPDDAVRTTDPTLTSGMTLVLAMAIDRALTQLGPFADPFDQAVTDPASTDPASTSPGPRAWATGVLARPVDRRIARVLHDAQRAEHAGWAADARSTLRALGPLDTVRFAVPVIATRLTSRRRTGSRTRSR